MSFVWSTERVSGGDADVARTIDLAARLQDDGLDALLEDRDALLGGLEDVALVAGLLRGLVAPVAHQHRTDRDKRTRS